MRPYADTNFLTRLYLELPGTTEAVQLLNQLEQDNNDTLPITFHHRLETLNAFQLLAFVSRQSPQQPRITVGQAAAAQADFRNDLMKPTFFQEMPIILVDLEKQFEELCLRYTDKHGFRTYDLLHVASALVLNCNAFWSFDLKASKLAALEGLKTRH